MLPSQPVTTRPHTLALALLAASAAAVPCAATGAAPARVDYARDIKPILRERCTACHGALQQKSGLRLDTAAFARKGGESGPAVVARKPGQSPLLLRITEAGSAERMPRDADALKPEQISLIRRWIAEGAVAPAGELPEPDPRDHWAFKPIVRPPVPTLGPRPSAPGNAIDAFINATLDREKLTPLPPAAKNVQLRRVYLDLIGLPPTREELRAFLDDPSPQAYERAVDRLLDDPRHGERWARHWMDVWRYADWFGRRMVPDVWNSAPQIWRWRDWIVTSLNADKGYDRLIAEMLAGDEVAPGRDDIAVATGYLVRNWYALNPNEWMRANVEHTGRAFLGLSFQCAHCHDHKYDPITQADYFSFRAFFEPLYVRQDRWPGEADPGVFQDYNYSTLRKVQRLGAVRVFDKDAAAKTWFYTGGDERNRLTNRPPAQPAMPGFLGGARVVVQPVALPPTVAFPGLKPFAVEAELARLVQAVATANQNLAKTDSPMNEARLTAAVAERESFQARLAADKARFLKAGGDTNALFRAASKADRQFKLATASETLLKAEADAAAAQRQSADAKDDKARETAKTAGKKADTTLASAKKAVADAQAALAKDSADYPPVTVSYPGESTGRRKALAQWMGSRDNPLTARVAVNHVWLRHFHAPLVETVDNFGRSGARPTHPELLDWLAAELMASDWSLKHLHRVIVTSAAYRRASAIADRGLQIADSKFTPAGRPSAIRHPPPTDPENKWLWRMNSGRSEAEVIRDSVLHLAGNLDAKMGGQELENPEMASSARRSLYFACFPELGGSGEFTSVFDPPNPNECYRRTKSVVPQQALALANSRLIHEQSAALARRFGERDTGGFITAAFEHLLSRPPSVAERAECVAFLDKQARSAAKDGERLAREGLVRALLNHSDFVTVR
ncbi:MAG: DUF1553 domain-containing protein [Verrucomicrobia bacterium]|nr:DUF1553 domain-containing protein [Verrucomicrobiota bacterium]